MIHTSLIILRDHELDTLFTCFTMFYNFFNIIQLLSKNVSKHIPSNLPIEFFKSFKIFLKNVYRGNFGNWRFQSVQYHQNHPKSFAINYYNTLLLVPKYHVMISTNFFKIITDRALNISNNSSTKFFNGVVACKLLNILPIKPPHSTSSNVVPLSRRVFRTSVAASHSNALLLNS